MSLRRGQMIMKIGFPSLLCENAYYLGYNEHQEGYKYTRTCLMIIIDHHTHRFEETLENCYHCEVFM